MKILLKNYEVSKSLEVQNLCVIHNFEYPFLVPVLNVVVEPAKPSSKLVGASVTATERYPLTAKATYSWTYALMYTGSKESTFVTTT